MYHSAWVIQNSSQNCNQPDLELPFTGNYIPRIHPWNGLVPAEYADDTQTLSQHARLCHRHSGWRKGFQWTSSSSFSPRLSSVSCVSHHAAPPFSQEELSASCVQRRQLHPLSRTRSGTWSCERQNCKGTSILANTSSASVGGGISRRSPQT